MRQYNQNVPLGRAEPRYHGRSFALTILAFLVSSVTEAVDSLGG
jgi:hypothetical protein